MTTPDAQPFLNLGILAHVDAGKTSLTERLLFETGTIDRLGSVGAGTTQTDSGELERERGITIRSAVTSFVVAGRRVNLLDTPGHSDFVAEVERALRVLDAAVLVVSAVDGVQSQTRVLAAMLDRLRLPYTLFINKIDRTGARDDDITAELADTLTPRLAVLGSVADLGRPEAAYRPHDADGLVDVCGPVLAEHDDELLAALVDDRRPTPRQIDEALRRQTAASLIHPVLFGSAVSGAGLADLLGVIGRLLPPAPAAESGLRGRVFAIEREEKVKIAYVRSYGGLVRERDSIDLFRREPGGQMVNRKVQVRGIQVLGAEPGTPLSAGAIARIRGLDDVRIGDQLGSAGGLDDVALFAPPSLETVVRPRHASQSTALHMALTDLADQDPFIQTRVTPAGDSSVLLYGEVQR